jgi:hypothetical protein
MFMYPSICGGDRSGLTIAVHNVEQRQQRWLLPDLDAQRKALSFRPSCPPLITELGGQTLTLMRGQKARPFASIATFSLAETIVKPWISSGTKRESFMAIAPER